MSSDGGYSPRVARILIERETRRLGRSFSNKKLILLAEEGLTIL